MDLLDSLADWALSGAGNASCAAGGLGDLHLPSNSCCQPLEQCVQTSAAQWELDQPSPEVITSQSLPLRVPLPMYEETQFQFHQSWPRHHISESLDVWDMGYTQLMSGYHRSPSPSENNHSFPQVVPQNEPMSNLDELSFLQLDMEGFEELMADHELTMYQESPTEEQQVFSPGLGPELHHDLLFELDNADTMDCDLALPSSSYFQTYNFIPQLPVHSSEMKQSPVINQQLPPTINWALCETSAFPVPIKNPEINVTRQPPEVYMRTQAA